MFKITVEDAIEADQVFADLMGEKTEPRKNFIFKNASFVKSIDT